MSKGSIRQKGSKWYYRFYIEDENGQHIQKEFVGSKSKKETEAMLRHALNEYEKHRYIASPGHITVGELLDMWIEENLKSSNKSNGTLMLYQTTVNRIKKHPIAQKKLKSITADHLQTYLDNLYFKNSDASYSKGTLAASTIRAYRAVLQGAFKYAVFPKKLLSCNPMEYVIPRYQQPLPVLFHKDCTEELHTITHSQFENLCSYLGNHPVLLPVQIAYYSGLRVGEICALTWDDVHLKEQYFFIQRTMYYNNSTHQIEISTPKGNKSRIVDFGNTLTGFLEEALQKNKQLKSYKNYYHQESELGRNHFIVNSFLNDQLVPENYGLLEFVCCKDNGTHLTPDYIGVKCRQASKDLGLSHFHFHILRHTYTSNLIQNGAAPKEVQELLGHSDISITMNIYTHSNRRAKRTSVEILDDLSTSISSEIRETIRESDS